MLDVTRVLNRDEMFVKDRFPFFELVITNSMKPMKQSMYSQCGILSPKSAILCLPPASTT